VLAIFTAFAYAELVTKYPQRGRSGHLHSPRLQDSVRELHGGLRGHVVRHNVGLRALHSVRR
jgi:hypothetical protein